MYLYMIITIMGNLVHEIWHNILHDIWLTIDHIRNLKSIKMHDFCFTIPYGVILVIGGIIGFVKKGSMASLAGGSGTGLLLILAGFMSLKAFEKRKNSLFAWFLEIACAIAVTFVMGQRYIQTSKIMPAGVVAVISSIMTLFYLYKLATGCNHIPPKAE